jgi:hypothetical protein
MMKQGLLGLFSPPPPPQKTKQGVCHTMAKATYIKKCLKAKEELWKLKYFTLQKYTLQKKKN